MNDKDISAFLERLIILENNRSPKKKKKQYFDFNFQHIFYLHKKQYTFELMNRGGGITFNKGGKNQYQQYFFLPGQGQNSKYLLFKKKFKEINQH